MPIQKIRGVTRYKNVNIISRLTDFFIDDQLNFMSASRNFSYLVDDAQEILHISGNNDFGQLSIQAVNQDEIEPPSASDPGPEDYGDRGILDQTQDFFSNINEDIVKVVTGVKHTAILTNKGNLYTAGSNRQGQLGVGGTSNVNFNGLQRLPSPLIGSVKNVWANGYFTIIQDRRDVLWAVGANESGQLITDTGGQNISIPRETNVTDPKHVALGYFHAVFINEFNRLVGTGYNRYGQLGIGHPTGTAGYNTIPTELDTNVVTADCGGGHTVWIKEDNTVWGLGHNFYGQLDPTAITYGTNDPNPTPIQMTWGPLDPNLSDQPIPVSVHCGTSHTIIRFDDGQVWGLGYNHWGQLGVTSDLAIPQTGAVDVVLPKLITTEVETLDTCATHTLFAKRNLLGDLEFFGTGENRSAALFRDPAVVQTVNDLLDVDITGNAVPDESLLFHITYGDAISPKNFPPAGVEGTQTNLVVNNTQTSITGADTLDLINQAPTLQEFTALADTVLPVTTADFFAMSFRMRVDALSQAGSTDNYIIEMMEPADGSYLRMGIDDTGLFVRLRVGGVQEVVSTALIDLGVWMRITVRIEFGQLNVIYDNLQTNNSRTALTIPDYISSFGGYTGGIGREINLWNRDALAYTASASRVDIYS